MTIQIVEDDGALSDGIVLALREPEQEFLDFMGETQPMRTLFDADEEHEAQIEEWLTSY